MDRLNYIIGQIDTSLKQYYFKDVRFYGQCRQELKKKQRQPVAYKGNGEYETAVFSDKNGLSVYHRVVNMSEAEDMNGGFGNNILKSETYQMVMVVFGSQKKVNNTAIDINYRVADELKGLIPTTLHSSHLTNINAQTLRINTTNIEYDKSKVFNEELPDNDYDVKPESILFSVKYSIAMRVLQDCKTMSCGDTPSSTTECGFVTIKDQNGAVVTTVQAGGVYVIPCGLLGQDGNQLYAQ